MRNRVADGGIAPSALPPVRMSPRAASADAAVSHFAAEPLPAASRQNSAGATGIAATRGAGRVSIRRAAGAGRGGLEGRSPSAASPDDTAAAGRSALAEPTE